MSVQRLEYIIAQNNFAQLKAKDIRLDNVGDSGNLKVLDFQNLKTEVQTLSSCIDQNEEKLEKMRQRYTSQKQKFEAVKGKLEDIFLMIQQQTEQRNLTEVIEKGLRSKIHLLKEEKNQKKNDYNFLLQKAGILRQKKLMLDYDKITDENEVLSKRISEIEISNKELAKASKNLRPVVKNQDSHADSIKLLDDLITCEEKLLEMKIKNQR